MERLSLAKRWIFLLVLTMASPVFAATTIKSIGFQVNEGAAQLTVQADGPVTFSSQELPEEKQVVLEIPDAKLSKEAKRDLPTSSFPSLVQLVKPYEKDGQVRIFITFKQYTKVNVTPSGNQLVVAVPATPNQDPSASTTATDTTKPSDSAKPGTGNAASDDSTKTDSTKKTDQAPVDVAKSSDPNINQDYLDQFSKSQSTQKWIGKPISLQVRDVDVTDVLRLIGEASGFNVIISSGVGGRLTLSLVDVPWDQVLDVVLQTMKLGADRSNNILRIMTLSELLVQKQEQLQAKNLALASAPRITRVFPISYADLAQITTIINSFAKGQQPTSGTGNNASTASQSGTTVVQDSRTNSLIVQDSPENIERIKKLIEILDTQTPQVIVEAKIVEASETFKKAFSGSLGFSTLGRNSTTASFATFAGGNPIDNLVSTGGGSTLAGSSSNGVVFGASPLLSFLPSLQRLNAVLSIAESENQVKLISSPKTVVLHKESATIVQSQPVLMTSTVVNNGVSTLQNVVSNANLSLNVSPTVTNDESVLMQLSISRDVPQELSQTATAVANRNITTKVLVDSGTTLVIGGIYTTSTNTASGGVPLLRKIPILGSIFGFDSENTNKSELMIFVTPKILNTKRAGLRS